MPTPEQQLQSLRDRIDATDESIIRLLIERIGIIREVAVLKAKNWPNACHIRSGREGRMHQALAKRFEGTGFPPLMALAIWRQLIGGSTHVESPLNVTYLAQFPEHQFLAREYFGVQISARKTETLVEACAECAVGKSNILILPTPRESDWWRNGAQLVQHGLFIFASLPVTEENFPHDATRAVALAPVTPENSGDDISYFLTTTGELAIIDGFTTNHDASLFLGAHPRPIRLPIGVPYA